MPSIDMYVQYIKCFFSSLFHQPNLSGVKPLELKILLNKILILGVNYLQQPNQSVSIVLMNYTLILK